MKKMNCFLLVFSSLIFHNELNAQVPVIKEPHHKPVLVNNYVRLLDVHINAADTTLYHVHAAPSIIVMISNSTIGLQKMGEAPGATSNTTAGATSFADYGANPVTHRVFNAGNNVFHVMDIELAKKEPSPDSCAPIITNNVETTINQKLARVYKFNLAAHQSFNINKSSCAHLLICISGAVTSSNKKIKTGEYIFFNPNTAMNINNNESENANCVLLELK